MILIDNTVLSNFALVKEMALLKEYCRSQGAMTGHVRTEFEKGIAQGILSDVNLDWLQKVDLEGAEEYALFGNLRRRLGAGEASCLAIAIRRQSDLLSDDMAVRKIALREGVRLSGSIGVLLELIRIGRISLETGNKILKGFIYYGYFAPVDKLNGLL
jgi:predicted nucleic acid-binding protein